MEKKTQNLIIKPPVVVVLGHIDHGKTSLLCAIRKIQVTGEKPGGVITQHIGAYQIEKEGKKITVLYLGDFEKKEFLEVLTTDEIGDRLWVDDDEKFFYTEQEEDRQGKVTETIHLVDIKNQTDDTLYSGSYISELTFDAAGRYLYFLEKQKEGENFDLTRLDLKNKEIKVILTDNYNKILLIR